MTTSVIIPCLNEDPLELKQIIANLAYNFEEDIQVIVINDGSITSDGLPMSYNESIMPDNLLDFMIINRQKRYGVGASFDLGVKYATGGIIVLMGADILVNKGWWLYDVLSAVHDDEIGCASSVGLQPGMSDISQAGLYHRYGATLTWTLTHDNLPKNSELRRDPNYREIVGCRWADKKSDEPYEIDAVYGAMYFTTKKFYEKFHGFDTDEHNPWSGHKAWGHLESMLSLKARVYGGRCVVYPDIKAGHIFGRITDVFKVRSIRADYHYWNRLWIAHTLLDDKLRDECLNHLLPCLNLSEAQAMIKRNWATVQEVRERNRREGKLISK
jgi:GT2 family glycosyltransferase